jgi:predicted enzyme related to lactoylglutathione lyase
MNIKMTSIPVKDPIKAFKFYTNILGFKEHLYMPEAHLAIVVSSEGEKGTTLLLEPIDDKIYRPFQKRVYEKGYPIIILGSNDIAKDYQNLIDKGVVFKTPPTTMDYGTIAIFDDTCGNYIQLHQDPK